MAFLEYANELCGWIPKLPLGLAQKLVNRAWQDIRNSRPWSFLTHEFDLVVPDMISTGTITAVQYTTTITGDAAASAAWAALANPVLTLRQFRLSVGEVYNIISADFTNPVAVILTLDRNFQGASGASQAYQIYQCYYPAPSSSFLRWVSCFDPINAYRFRPHNLHRLKTEIDRIDPQRASSGQAYWLASYKVGTVGADPNVPFFELWPHVTSKQNFLTLYQDKGADFALPTDALPPQIPEEVLTFRARYHAYEWAEANKGLYPAMAVSRWLELRIVADRDYRLALGKACKLDDECFLQMWVEQFGDMATLGPLSSDWLQVHASPWG